MHPLFSRATAMTAYLALWSVIGVGIALVLVLQHGWTPEGGLLTAIPLAIGYGVACLAAWSVCRAFPLTGAARTWRVLLAHVAAGAFTSTVWVALAQGWSWTVTGRDDWTRSATLQILLAGLLLFLLSSAVHYVFLALEAQEAARRQALESAVLAREAELRALRAQVNPHFLFNSLHSIGSLAGVRPAAARDMAIALGEFLRHSLRLGALSGVPLQQEIDLVAQYLSIEQVRFGDRLQVHIAVEPQAGDSRVPPLLLQPLVENAIKHGVAGLLDPSQLSIEARLVGAHCRVTVGNAFDPEAQPVAGTGMGLRNVRDRLAAHFGPPATLDARVEGDRFTVTIAFPYEVGPSGPGEHRA